MKGIKVADGSKCRLKWIQWINPNLQSCGLEFRSQPQPSENISICKVGICAKSVNR